MGALSSAYLMYYLDKETWLRLLIWLVIGLTIYFFYSRTHSRLAPTTQDGPARPR
jgi:APA family basic amino acid/polyamine antiporter